MSQGLYESALKALAANTEAPTSLPNPDRRVSVDNPFCGDRIDLELCVEAGKVIALAHNVRGCMLCQASANAVAQAAIGLSLAEVDEAESRLKNMLAGAGDPQWPPDGWEQLALFEPVSGHKSRHGCVTLPFTALRKALG